MSVPVTPKLMVLLSIWLRQLKTATHFPSISNCIHAIIYGHPNVAVELLLHKWWRNLQLLSGTRVLVRSVELSLDTSEEQRLASDVIDGDELTFDDNASELLSANVALTDEECGRPNTRLGDLRFSAVASHGVDLESAVRKLSVLWRTKLSLTVKGRLTAFRLHERAAEILAVISDRSPPTFSGECSSKELRTGDEADNVEAWDAQSVVTWTSLPPYIWVSGPGDGT